jgi:hypothetical protein
MKNNKKFLMFGKTMIIAMLVFGLILAGCKTDDDDDDSSEETRSNPILGETFPLSGKIYGFSWNSGKYTPLTNVTAVTVTGPFTTPITADVTGSSDFSVTIPKATTTNSSLTTVTKTAIAGKFYLGSDDKITTLNPTDANFGVLSLSATASRYGSTLSLGTKSMSGNRDNGYQSDTSYEYIYVDKDVTIRGSARYQVPEFEDDGDTIDEEGTTTVNLSLKEGWNVVEKSGLYTSKKLAAAKYKRTNTETYSVNGIPESAKWSLEKI